MFNIFITLLLFFSSFKAYADKLPNANDAYRLLGLDKQLSYWKFKNAYNHFKRNRRHKNVFTIIDYTLPSSKERFWVIDMDKRRVEHATHVSHGINSGSLYSRYFSNIVNSKQTSVGVFLANETYEGIHGYSLRLDGLSGGLNDKARERAIVVHGADYAHPNVVEKAGQLGTSWGCPAVPSNVSKQIINKIKEGTYIYAFPMP